MNSVLFLGPSKYALEGFDYSILQKYEKVARINKYLEIENPGRCDLLFLNSNCVKFYLNKSVDKLLGKKIYVKRRAEKVALEKKSLDIEVEEMEDFWKLHMKYFQPHQPYCGTLAINFLRKRYKKVDVAGIDFYYNGFSSKEAYIDGYYDLQDKITEDPQHSIKKDIAFMKKIMQKENVNFIHKTKEIFMELVNE